MRFKWLKSLQKEENLKVYTKNPPGKLSIARLLRQLPAFEQRRVGLMPKPRRLIINIWTKHLDPVAVKRKIVELMQEGHQVYLPIGDNKIKLLDDAWIESGVIDFQNHPPYDEYYHGIFTTLGGDDTHVLTHYDMERLIADDENLPTSIVYAKDFFPNRDIDVDAMDPTGASLHSDRAQLPQKHDDPEHEKTSHIITRVVCETYHADHFYEVKAQRWGQTRSNNRYEYEAAFHTAILRDASITILLLGGTLLNKPMGFRAAYLQNLKTFGYILPSQVEGAMDEDTDDETEEEEYKNPYYDYSNPQPEGPECADVAALLTRTPNLENLMLGRVAHPNTNWPRLPKLGKLVIGYATNTASLFSLLAAAPNLKTLKIRQTLSPGKATPPPLPSIRDFSPGNSVEPDMLFTLLQSMTGLKKLRFDAPIDKNWNVPRMPRLKSLRTTTTFYGSLATLLENCPMLEYLDATHGFSTDRFNRDDREQLIRALQQSTNLKTLTVPEYIFWNKKCVIPLWETILEHAPNLDEDTKAAIASTLERTKRGDVPLSVTLGNIASGIGAFFVDGFTNGFGGGGEGGSGVSLSDVGFSSSSSSSSSSSQGRNRGGRNNQSHAPSNHNTPFDPSSMRNHRPSKPTKGADFQHSGHHQALNQAMVMDQYCRYLQIHGKTIPNIHDGICNALSHLCAGKAPLTWQANLELLRSWDGKKESLTRAHYKLFGEIQTAIETYQEMTLRAILTHALHQQYGRTWLGESAIDWLSSKKPGEVFILTNAWHAICVRKLADDPVSFIAYDPNFKEGNLQVSAEKLGDFLRQSLGDLNLVMVEGVHAAPNLRLSNPETFIANGGLFQAACAQNKDALLALLTQAEIPATPATLSGLFLRDLEGIPLWYSSLGMDNPRLKTIALNLLAHFMDKNPDNWWKRLAESAECIKGFDLDKMLPDLYRTFDRQMPDNTPLQAVSEIPELLQARRMKDDDTRSMQPQNNARRNLSLEEKLTALATSEKPSHLITLMNPDQVRMTRFALEARARATGRPVIYIDSPSDLTLSNPFVQMQEDGVTGLFQRGPGGHIYDALKAAVRPLIIVNYDNFPPGARVTFNTLFDDKPMADIVELPAGSTVVALQNLTNTASYKGSDMSSRFAERDIWQKSTNAYPALPKIPAHTAADAVNEEGIELYQGADWKERLLGTWSPRGDRLVWMEGELAQALQKSPHLRIQNAPLHDPEYMDFWREAVQRGWIATERGRLVLPANFSLRETTGFDWEALNSCIGSLQDGMDPACPHILNTSTLEDFLTHYTCDDASETLSADENHLETLFGHNSRVTINLSHSVCSGDLARFLTACKARDITLDLRCAEGVTLPDVLASRKAAAPSQAAIPARAHTRMILSDDPDAACASERTGGALVIDLSECEAGHLIDTIDGALNPKSARLHFKNRLGLLPQRLQAGQTLILTGTFSDEVAETLTPLLLARLNGMNASGNLVLIPRNAKNVALQFLPAEQHAVTLEEKRQLLPGSNFDDETLQRHGLVQLDAMARFQRATGSTNARDAWAGLYRLDVNLKSREFDADNSAAIADAFDAGRLEAMEQRLTDSPVVVITGLTGVGKSTTIERGYAERHPNIHYGEAATLAWAEDRRPGRKTLFLDEANIGGNHWSAFEGLYENPPFVRIGNKIVMVTEEHCVVAACNPVNYGDRKLPSLFERHGNALVFEPMPQEYIYERMLKPLLSLTFDDAHMKEIARIFLSVYHFLCECSETSVLISPRELVMMARMTMAHQNPLNTPVEVARHYARLLTKDLVPQKHRGRFNELFPPVSLHMRSYAQTVAASVPTCSSSSTQPESSTQPDTGLSSDFLVTPSREPLASLINDLLNLREMGRAMDPKTTPKDFLYGGLGGLIIEGAPGQGKSEMVKNLLKIRGYGNNLDKAGWFIPASMNEDEKRKTLLKAFDMGAVVILDEINSCPMMEDFLNDLLMGKHPTEGKRPPKEPGFLLIGTQNPASMGGRQRTSNALMRRVISHKLPDYTEAEMMNILTTCPVPGMPAKLSRMRALHLLEIYRVHARHGMTFRDVLKRAREIIQHERPDLQMPDETFGFTLENPPQPARQPVPPALQPLFDAIAELRSRGLELQSLERYTPAERIEGLTAARHAGILETCARSFSENPRAHRDAFKTALHVSFEAMSTHRNVWHPILHKILRAFQAFLTCGIIVALHGDGFFSTKTDRQRLVRRVEKTLDRIADDAFEPVEPVAAPLPGEAAACA